MNAAGRDSWQELARAAAEPHRAPELEEERQLLAFSVAGDAYALPVERVRGISRLRPVTAVPRVPADVRGVISLRGEIVQVVDLASRMGLPGGAPARRGRIVVVYAGDAGVAGLLVDEVTEVMRVRETALRPVSGDAERVEALCVCGDRFVSLLDLDKVLDFDAGS